MTTPKESNSFKCYLSNIKTNIHYKEMVENDYNSITNKKKLIAEINELKKSLVDLQIEKEDLNLQLIQQFKELKRSERTLKKDIHKGLEEIMFMISHKVRLPLTNILGLANLLTNINNSNEENLEFIELIKASAGDLDKITKELGAFIYELDQSKNNHPNK